MAAKKLNEGVTCTVGATVAPGLVELIATGPHGPSPRHRHLMRV